MRMFVTHINYKVENKKLVVYIYGRGEDRERKVLRLLDTKPYFYAPTPIEHANVTSIIPEAAVDIFGIPLDKIYVDYPFNVPKVRKGKTWEADVLYDDRIRYDCGIKGCIEVPDDKTTIVAADVNPIDMDINPEYCVIDIETDNSVDEKQTPAQILSISIYDSKKQTYYSALYRSTFDSNIERILRDKGIDKPIKIKCVDSERELFKFLEDYIRSCQPDILLAWNGRDFDAPYLINRAKKIKYGGIEGLAEIEVLDIMLGYDILTEGTLDSMSLDFCAKKELDVGKVEYEGTLKELLTNKPDKLLEYNIWDVYLTHEIAKRRNILYYFTELSKLAGCSIGSIFTDKKPGMKHKRITSIKVVESAIFHYLHDKNIILPTRYEHEYHEVPGAYVHEPARGLYENVIVLDLKTEYPAMVIALNASPEMKEVSFGKVVFRRDKKGIIPEILEGWIERRNQVKRTMNQHEPNAREWKTYYEMQRALKYLTNAFIGVSGNKWFRLCDEDIIKAVIEMAHKHIKFMIARLKEWGYKIIYSDTDSIMIVWSDVESLISVPSLVDRINNELHSEFLLEYGITKHNLSIEFEKVYEKFFQAGRDIGGGKMVGKKRYVGLLLQKDGKNMKSRDLDDRMEVRGFQYKRSDASDYTREIQMLLFKELLAGDVKGVTKFLLQEQAKFDRKDIPLSDIGLPIGINKPLKDYKGNSIHVRAVKFSNANLSTDFKFGDRIRYYFLIGGDVMAVERTAAFPKGYESKVDWKEHKRRCLIQPLEPILEVIGLKYVWVSGMNRSIFDFGQQTIV